jgi:hypothetical protein
MQKNPRGKTTREQLSFSTNVWAVIRRLIETIPCASCREHAFQEYATASKLILTKQHGLREWICQFHNRVNIRLGRPTWNENGTLAWVSAVHLLETFDDYMKAIQYADNSPIRQKLREDIAKLIV